MNDTTLQIVLVLSGYLVASHLFFLFVINKLVNKVMSRNFFEYQQKPTPKKERVLVEDEPQDYIGRIFS